MVQNNKFRAAMVLAAALMGMGICTTASALPEMEVGTLPPFAAPSSVDTVDSTVAEPVDVEAQDSAS